MVVFTAMFLDLSCSFFPDYFQLWQEFQAESLARLKAVSNDPELEVIIWTSDLTDLEHLDLVSNQDYVIDIWTDSTATDVRMNALKRLNNVFPF